MPIKVIDVSFHLDIRVIAGGFSDCLACELSCWISTAVYQVEPKIQSMDCAPAIVRDYFLVTRGRANRLN
jgi:hypothetical protein